MRGAQQGRAVASSREPSYKNGQQMPVDSPHAYLLRVAVPAIAAGFAICAAAAEQFEHVSTQADFASHAAGPGSSVDIEAALARVNAARSRADADPLELEDALTALGNAFLNASQYATAEASYAEALALAERHGGLNDERLLAPLMGLASALAGPRRYEETVPLLQRALGIERSQYGLFDLRQQDTLKALADSLTALNRTSEAQDLMIYRARVAEKTYGEGDPKVVPALCELGDWFAEVGKSLEARMTFNMALNIVGSRLSVSDLAIVEPLRGIARTRMRAVSWPESALRPHESSAARVDALGIPIVGARVLNREGEYALQHALRILDTDPHAPTQTRIDTLIQMGDWYQIKNSPREALPYYQRAWQLMHAAPDPANPATTALSFPVRVYYPTPQIVVNDPALPPEETTFHHVQIEFTVAADGSVSGARILEHDTRDRYADDILSALRAARYRPKFVDGEAVETPGMLYREVFRTAKPRT